MSIDPVIACSIRLALALLFGVAAVHKLADRQRFEATLRAYELTSPLVAMLLATLLPWIELALAIGLVLTATRQAAAVGAVVILTLYSLAIAVNLYRGRRSIDCGCFVASAGVPLSGGLVVRNLGLIGAAVVSMLPARYRPLLWVDAMTVSMTLLAVAVLWSAAGRLARTGPALRRIGGMR